MPTVAERALAGMRCQVAEHLRGVRERLAEELRSYPTPIPRCDAQFNHLYDQLGRLSRDLDAIEGAASERAAVKVFVASAPYTDDPSERELRSRMRKALQSAASV